MIPTDARIILDTIAEGLTPDQYREVIWFMREPVKIRSRGGWPIQTVSRGTAKVLEFTPKGDSQ